MRHCPEDGTPLGIESDRTLSAPLAAAAMAEQSEHLPTGTPVGEYVIETKIGEGGMGCVYAAVHPLIGKKAAIKVISRNLCTDRTAVERFVMEARAVNQIGHPNIVDVFNFGTLADGRSYFVMEWLQGETLGERIERGGLSLGETSTILDQIADALEAAHEKGIVHRDLKPDNAFLVRQRSKQVVKLLDFGIAKLAGTADQRMERTRTGTMMGTPAYISPEQARGKSVDYRTDIYSLGCITFEMLCGRLPFEADNPMDMIASHLSAPPPRPVSLWPEIPPHLDTLIVDMMDKDPGRRPPLAVVRAHLQEFGGTISSVMARTGSSVSQLMARAATPVGSPAFQRAATPVPGASVSPAAQRDGSAAPRSSKRIALIAGAVAAALVGVAVVAVVAGGGNKDKAPVPAPSAGPADPSLTPAAGPSVTPLTPGATGTTPGATGTTPGATGTTPGATATPGATGTTPGTTATPGTDTTAAGTTPPEAGTTTSATNPGTTPEKRTSRTSKTGKTGKTGKTDTTGKTGKTGKDPDYTIDPFRRKPR